MDAISSGFNTGAILIPVLACATAHWFAGGLWFSPVMVAAPYTRLVLASRGVSRNNGKLEMEASMMLVSVIASICQASSLFFLFRTLGVTNVEEAAKAVIFLWLGFVVASSAPDYAFKKHSLGLFAIHIGHLLFALLASAFVYLLF